MKVINLGVVAGFAAATLVSLAPAADAAASTTVMIRQGDFVSALGDTRTSGHVEFLKEGLHVWTDDASGDAKAAEYVAVPTQGLPASASLTWYGTQPQPGSQILFDVDGDRTNANTFNVLVGEPVYNGDYWYSGGTTRAAAHGVTCPQTTGGSGSDCHGTLAEWQAAVPTAEVYAVGFSLGSGIKGDGVIRDIQVGDTDYQFTSEPAVTKVAVTGTATASETVRPRSTTLSLRFATHALSANQVQGRKLTFKVVDNGEVVFRDAMGAAEKSSVKLHFTAGSGRHKVQILKNGAVDRTFKINMGH
jgi:flagellar hook-basal body complex protein FliE